MEFVMKSKMAENMPMGWSSDRPNV